MSAWRAIETDDRYRVKFTTWRCDGCHRLAVTTHDAQPTTCVCASSGAARRGSEPVLRLAAGVLLLALWAACGGRGAACPRPAKGDAPAPSQSCQPRPAMIERVAAPCLTLAPPAALLLTGDPDLDRGRRSDAYAELERWVRLYAWPVCSAP